VNGAMNILRKVVPATFSGDKHALITLIGYDNINV